MAIEALFISGEPTMDDYTPSSALVGGTVVVVGQRPLVAHRNCAANEKGALASGGGVYELTADGAIGDGVAVYWNDSTNKATVTTNSGNNKHFGFGVPGSTASSDGDKIRVRHNPYRAGI